MRGVSDMSSKQGMGWLARAALLAAVLIVPACGGGGPSPTPSGTTSSLWNSTSTGGGTFSPGGGVIWNNPNNGPIGTGTGNVDLAYGTVTTPWNGPVKYPSPPNSIRPVYLTAPLVSAEEFNIEGQADGYRQAWLNANNGGAFNNNNFGFNQLPPLYISTNLRSVARARCKDLSAGNGAALETLNDRMIAAKLKFVNNSGTEFYATGADAGAAWTAFGANAQTDALNGGWFGGGYWTSPPYWGLVFCQSNNSTGP